MKKAIKNVRKIYSEIYKKEKLNIIDRFKAQVYLNIIGLMNYVIKRYTKIQNKEELNIIDKLESSIYLNMADVFNILFGGKNA